MVDLSLIRAPLFVPAHRPDRFAKAAASGADGLILDLEDAVPVADKDTARAALAVDFTDLPVLVRVNARDTIWHDADLQAVTALRPAGVILHRQPTCGQQHPSKPNDNARERFQQHRATRKDHYPPVAATADQYQPIEPVGHQAKMLLLLGNYYKHGDQAPRMDQGACPRITDWHQSTFGFQ